MGDTAASIELEEYAWRRSPSPTYAPGVHAMYDPTAVDVHNVTTESAGRTRFSGFSQSQPTFPEGQTYSGCSAESCGLPARSILKKKKKPSPRAQCRGIPESKRQQDSAVSVGGHEELFDHNGVGRAQSGRSIVSCP